MEKVYEWPEHIYNALTKDTFGYTVTPFSIALEGWRRGLTLTFHYTKQSKSKALFSLSDGESTHKFRASRGDLVSKEAARICIDKYKTKEYLQAKKVPTPKGKQFDENVADDIIVRYANETGYPLVIKPVDGTGGNGVITGIKNEESFIKALKYIRHELNYKNVLVEESFVGEDYRVYVVGDKAVGATKRIAPNVIGNGKSTIKELIREKNQMKKDSLLYRTSLIKINSEVKDYLSTQNLTLDTVIEEGKRIIVNSKNNVTAGGDPIDATDELSEYAKNVAINAAKAIPDLPQAGVDIMMNHDTGEVTVLEINSRANIRLNLFPMEGKGRDIPKAIIDYYFPETQQKLDSPLYFDFGNVWQTLKEKTVNEVTIDHHPKDQLVSKLFIIPKNMKFINYGKWVKDKANKNNIFGYIKYLNEQSTVIVAVGTKENVELFYKTLKNPENKKFQIDEIDIKERKTPVLNEFYIENKHLDEELEDGYYPVILRDKSVKNIKKIKSNKINQLNTKNKKQTIDYEKEYKKVINSKSWKITKPIRMALKKLKKG